MPPFTGQVIGIAAGGEFDPPVDKTADHRRAFFHNHPYHILVADACTGNQRVFHMGIKGIILGRYGGDTALGIIGSRFRYVPFGDYGDLAMGRCLKGKGQTGNATADYQKIIFKFHANLLPVPAVLCLPKTTGLLTPTSILSRYFKVLTDSVGRLMLELSLLMFYKH